MLPHKRLLSSGVLRLLVAALILITVSFIAVRFVVQKIDTARKTITFGLVGQPVKINPIFTTGNAIDLKLVPLFYRGLIKYDKGQQPIPDLASDWQIADNGKIYNFTIADNLKWTDGEPITAEDVAYTYNLIKTTPNLLANYAFLNDISVEIVNTNTIRFTLSESYSPIISLLNIGILPKHKWEDLTFDEMLVSQLNLMPIGSTNLAVNDIQLKNDLIAKMDFKSANKAELTVPFEIRFYQTNDDLHIAYKKGLVDSITTVSGFNDPFNDLTTWQNTNTITSPVCGINVDVFFNLSDENEVTSKREFRTVIMNLLNANNDLIVSPNPLSNRHWAYLATTPVSKTRAEIESEVSGFTNLNPIKIVALSDQTIKETAEKLNQSLQDYKIATELVYIEKETLEQRIFTERDFDIFIIAQEVARDPDQYNLWHSSQTEYAAGGLNISRYSDRRMDKALEEGRTSVDPVVRKTSYTEMQNRLMADIPAVFIQYPSLVTYLRINHELKPKTSCAWTPAESLINLLDLE